MESEFIPYKIEDIAKEMGDAPFGSNLKNVDYTDSGALVVQGKNIQGLRFDWSTKRHVSIEKWTSIPRSQCFVGDLIFPKVGTIGKVGILTPCDGYDNYLLSTNTMRLKVDTNIAVQKYVYYFFSWNKTVHLINAMSSTSVQPVFNYTTLKRFTINLPPIPEQKTIAHILGSLDEKIELNRQMNETLEAMAQALFKSWFVDFDPAIDNALAAGNAIPDVFAERAAQRKTMNKDEAINPLFPDAFEYTEEMGWIPEGWEAGKLGTHIAVKRGGSPRPIQDYLAPEGLPWVKISDATASGSRFLAKTKQFIKPEGLKKTTLLKKGALILSNSATPGLPKFLELDACIHDGWLHFPEKVVFTDNYLYQLFLEVRAELLLQGNGSVFTNLKTDILKNHNMVVPDTSILKFFEERISSIHNRLQSIQSETETLSKLRDTLLPKLLSGELRIPDAKQLIEEVEV